MVATKIKDITSGKVHDLLGRTQSEPSEHLGLVVPGPGIHVHGETFTHPALTPDQLNDLKNADSGESYSYYGADGRQWTATVSLSGLEVEFTNSWKKGSRSFRVLWAHLR